MSKKVKLIIEDGHARYNSVDQAKSQMKEIIRKNKSMMREVRVREFQVI